MTMTNQVQVRFLPQDRTAAVRKGSSILAAARQANVTLSSKCGGRGACTTCKVQILSETPLQPPSRMEKHMLSEEAAAQGFRLGCQTALTGHAVVTLPEDPLKRVIRLQLEAARREREEGIE